MTNPVSQKILRLMKTKQSNLALSLDVTDTKRFFQILEAVGEEIVVLKTHIDVISDFSPDFIDRLLTLQEKYQFVIFEDRKFADIGNTVKLQYTAGIYKMIEWTQLVNAHVFPGPGIVQGLRQAWRESKFTDRGLILLPQMTSAGNLFDGRTMASAINWAREYSDYVIGFIGAAEVSTAVDVGETSPESSRALFWKKLRATLTDLVNKKKSAASEPATDDQIRQEFTEIMQSSEGQAPAETTSRELIDIEKPSLIALREATWPEYLIMVPGVNLADSGDQLGQTYVTPQMAVEQGADIIIVGRGIYEAREPGKAAAAYRMAGWAALAELS